MCRGLKKKVLKVTFCVYSLLYLGSAAVTYNFKFYDCGDICRRPGPTVLKLLDWMPPTNSCLSILIFESDAQLRLEISWILSTTASIVLPSPPFGRHWLHLCFFCRVKWEFQGNDFKYSHCPSSLSPASFPRLSIRWNLVRFVLSIKLRILGSACYFNNNVCCTIEWMFVIYWQLF